MRLVEVALENFRGYGRRTVLPVDDLTVLVGKNDAGKSTFLEALNIALGDSKEAKVDASDIHVRASAGDSLYFECAFDELPASLTLDSTSRTSLQDEFLVDSNGLLRVRWDYPIQDDAGTTRLGRGRVCIIAQHPSVVGLENLHACKNAALKKLVNKADLGETCARSNNTEMRQALWKHARASGDLMLRETVLDLAKEDGKSILAQITAALPMYALFRADRPSTDQDAEVQDPMKVAVRAALEELRPEVDAMKQRVKDRALQVATRTLDSLREFDDDLASSLTPEFADPKLESAFKLTLFGDDGIAVNKRGSGVRRLVLFSFFRAEADRRHSDATGRQFIYAVEEPETAQHPDFQRKVISALSDLSATDGCQVLATTHSPGLAGLVPSESLRLVTTSGTDRTLKCGDDAMEEAVRSLGVVPDHRVRVLLCVEGPYDRAFLQAACKAYRGAGEDFACLETDPAIAFVLLGGSTLLEWVHGHLLGELQVPEFHLYDGDVEHYEDAMKEVNKRGNGHSAQRTSKRELENYLHPDAIRRVLAGPAEGLEAFEFGAHDDVEAKVAAAMPDNQGNPRKKLKRRALKHWLNHEVAAAMTVAEFDEQDQSGEIRSWLSSITTLARGA